MSLRLPIRMAENHDFGRHTMPTSMDGVPLLPATRCALQVQQRGVRGGAAWGAQGGGGDRRPRALRQRTRGRRLVPSRKSRLVQVGASGDHHDTCILKRLNVYVILRVPAGKLPCPGSCLTPCPAPPLPCPALLYPPASPPPQRCDAAAQRAPSGVSGGGCGRAGPCWPWQRVPQPAAPGACGAPRTRVSGAPATVA